MRLTTAFLVFCFVMFGLAPAAGLPGRWVRWKAEKPSAGSKSCKSGVGKTLAFACVATDNPPLAGRPPGAPTPHGRAADSPAPRRLRRRGPGPRPAPAAAAG